MLYSEYPFELRYVRRDGHLVLQMAQDELLETRNKGTVEECDVYIRGQWKDVPTQELSVLDDETFW